MPMTCTVCRHNDRKGIERALIRGDSLRDIARHHQTSKDAVQRHRRCFAEAYDRVSLSGDTDRVVSLRTELDSAIAEVKNVYRAAKQALEDPKQPGRFNLNRKSGLDAAKLLLQASDRLDKHLRMMGDLTGAFKAPEKSPRDVSFRLYDEWVNFIVKLAQTVLPNVERRSVVELLAEMPETAGEFLPLVQAELARTGHLRLT